MRARLLSGWNNCAFFGGEQKKFADNCVDNGKM